MPEDFNLQAREARLARNQALFRSINERVEELAETHGLTKAIGFVCECANPDCASGLIELDLNEYEEVRRDPRHFPVLADHVFPEVEDVVSDHGRYVVVEKIGVAGELVAAADPRAAG
jgi:hypothetical protein